MEKLGTNVHLLFLLTFVGRLFAEILVNDNNCVFMAKKKPHYRLCRGVNLTDTLDLGGQCKIYKILFY